MRERFEEPALPGLPRAVRRALVAVWISLGLHAAVIVLVQVAPPAGGRADQPTIEVRLMPASEPVSVHATMAGPAPDELPVAAAAGPAPTPPPLPMPAAPGAAAVPALAVDSAVDLTYYTARELDVQPRALQDIQPTYPPEADRLRQSGTVRLELKIEADGRVSDVSVVGADPPDVFDESARAAFAAARFSPAQKNGRPVRMRMLVEVSYVRDQRPGAGD